MILRDYSCSAHGFFESSQPVCPHGCKGELFIQIVHLQAPSIGSARTKNIDKTLVGLANQFGLTDMSNRGGDPVKKVDSAAMKRLEEYQDIMKTKFGDPWQSVAPGGLQRADGSIDNRGGGGGAIQSIQGFGAQGGSAITRDSSGKVSVPVPDAGIAIPLDKNIKPDTIAGKYEAEIKV